MADATANSPHRRYVETMLDSFKMKGDDFDERLDAASSKLVEFVGGTGEYKPDVHGSQVLEKIGEIGWLDKNRLSSYVKNNGDCYDHESVEAKLSEMGFEPEQAGAVLQLVNNGPKAVAHLNGCIAEQNAPAQSAQAAPVVEKVTPAATASVTPEFSDKSPADSSLTIRQVQHALGLQPTEGELGVYSDALGDQISERTKEAQAALGVENPDGKYTPEFHKELDQYLVNKGLDGDAGTDQLREFHVAMEQMQKTKAYADMQQQFAMNGGPVSNVQFDPPAGAEMDGQQAMQVAMLVGVLNMVDDFFPGLRDMLAGAMEDIGTRMAENNVDMNSVMGNGEGGLAVLSQAVLQYLDQEPEPEQKLESEKVVKFAENKGDIAPEKEQPAPVVAPTAPTVALASANP